MIIKVCGMRDAENIRAVEREAAPDWMGFIFYAPSPRYVAERPDYLPEECRRVGVFVRATYREIISRVEAFGLQAVQLHGEVYPEQCRKLRERGLTVLRALPVDEHLAVATQQYEGCVDYFLFDTPTPLHGGSGLRYDWKKLQVYHGHTPFLLSGGLKADLLKELLHFRHPRWAGIDLNSGFEMAPALKDVQTLKPFIQAFRRHWGEEGMK